MINVESLRLMIVERLPVRARWSVRETPWDWDFSRATRPLEPLSASDAERWLDVLPPDWRQLMIFGEENFANGGGARPFVSVHAQTGVVWGIDVERESAAVFLHNSSVSAFMTTFLALDEALRAGATPAADLGKRLREIDPSAFDESEWRDLIEHLEAP